jgi:Zn ribbon nucleic-acid-binding protein
MKKKKTKRPKYIVEEVTETTILTGQGDVCPKCDSLMKISRQGTYEEATCVGCGYSETSTLTNPL